MTDQTSATISVDVSRPRHDVSPLLYGVFLEEINFAGAGGIYAEKIQNRAFMDHRTPRPGRASRRTVQRAPRTRNRTQQRHA